MSQNKNGIKNKIVGGLVWVFGERVLAQLVSMIVTIVLARLLSPEHYGMISIVTVFITFLNVFVTSGFGSALVQKKDADTLDFNTAFMLSFCLSLVLYALLFVSAPFISRFYEMPLLSPVLRVMGLRLPLASINNIQRAYVQREMNFKNFFLVTIVGTVVSGVAGVALAYVGFGVWALVAQYLGNTVVGTFMLFIVCKWRPKKQYSSERAKKIWSFGSKVLATQLVTTFESNLRSLIIGRVFGSSDLAYYDQGQKYPALLVTNISASIDSVMFSAYSKEQDDLQKLLAMLRRSVRVGLYLLTPLLLGFAALSNAFVSLLLTEVWLPAVPFMQVFCLSFLSRPMEASCRQALTAIGKSGVVFVVITVINIVALIGTLIAVFVLKSVFAIAIVSLVITAVSLIGFLSCSAHYLKYSFRLQMRDMLPPILLGCVMYIAVYFVGKIEANILLVAIVQIAVGVAVYVGCSAIFKFEAFNYLLGMFKRKKQIRRKSYDKEQG